MTTSAPTRINARLDESRSGKLEFLRRATGLSVSEIVKRGIDALYDEQRRGNVDAARIFERTGFIGSGAGPGDLSERYKEELAEILAAKHGPR